MNGERVFYADAHYPLPQTVDETLVEGTNTHFQYFFSRFIETFTQENTRIYYKQLETQIMKRKYYFTVELADLKAYEEQLIDRIYAEPVDMIKSMEMAIRQYLREHTMEFPGAEDREWQVAVKSDEFPLRLREISSTMVAKLFAVSGIIITSTKPYIKASKLKLKCKNCQTVKVIELAPGQNPYIPTYCQGLSGSGSNQRCPNDPFVAMPDSEVIDAQSLKIQESP